MAIYKVLHRNRIIDTIPDVLSETSVDEEVYDLTNYRDIIDAQYVGQALTPTGGGISIGSTPVNVPTGQLADAIIQVPAGTYVSISDMVSHIAPRPEKKKRTKLKLWSQAAGAGNVLYSAWEDRLESWGVISTITTV